MDQPTTAMQHDQRRDEQGLGARGVVEREDEWVEARADMVQSMHGEHAAARQHRQTPDEERIEPALVRQGPVQQLSSGRRFPDKRAGLKRHRQAFAGHCRREGDAQA